MGQQPLSTNGFLKAILKLHNTFISSKNVKVKGLEYITKYNIVLSLHVQGHGLQTQYWGGELYNLKLSLQI